MDHFSNYLTTLYLNYNSCTRINSCELLEPLCSPQIRKVICYQVNRQRNKICWTFSWIASSWDYSTRTQHNTLADDSGTWLLDWNVSQNMLYQKFALRELSRSFFVTKTRSTHLEMLQWFALFGLLSYQSLQSLNAIFCVVL